VILSGLIVAFITLLVERAMMNRVDYYKAGSSGINADGTNADGTNADGTNADGTNADDINADGIADDPYDYNSVEEEDPKGLFNPRGNIGWDSYTNERLAAELHRSSSFEQDLVFLAMELKGAEKVNDSLYCKFTEEAVNFFTMRDLIFGKGENGIAVIMPNIDLDQGISKSEQFRRRLIPKLQELSASQNGTPWIELCVGLSSRSGRLIEADRLILEAQRALEKAMADPVSRIVAFKSDPEKYREFIKANQR
jgi:hypothetical protein